MKRKKPAPTIMERTVAARDYINRVPHNQERAEDLEIEAFMAIFHPEVSPAKVLEMRLGRRRH